MTFSELVKFGAEHNASDIILSPGMPPGIRLNGVLTPAGKQRLDGSAIEQIIRDLVTSDEFDELQKTRELDFAAVCDGQRFRGNAFWRLDQLGLALRPIASTVPDPVTLGIPQSVIDLTDQSHGLILFTGAAGHGKSTSQASLIERINGRHAYHIVTVEDPIEFVHTSNKSYIEQREVGSDTLTFANALRHTMRQNPDVILVGEMRDRETMQAVLTVAETGHLVFSTLHTNDACQAIDRIIDVFPESGQAQIRTQISLALLAVVNQRLVTSRTGGRVLAAEVLMNTTGVANLIREGKTEQLYSMFDMEGTTHAHSMNRALQDLVDKGLIDAVEAKRHQVLRESPAVSRRYSR